MQKFRVWELAKQYNKTDKDIISTLKSHNVEVKSHLSVVDEKTKQLLDRVYAGKPATGSTANGKALTLGETAGVVKVIAREDDGKLLGVHVFGAHAGDLVASVTPVMARGGNVDDFLTAITAHPSLGEAVSEAMEKIRGSAIHAR